MSSGNIFLNPNNESLCTHETLHTFQDAWNAADRLATDERVSAQVSAILTSQWLLGAAYLQEVGVGQIRRQHAAAIVDQLADAVLAGKQFHPKAEHFGGFWWTVVRRKRIDYWRTHFCHLAIEQSIARSRESFAADATLITDAADTVQSLSERQKALVQLVVSDGFSLADAIIQLASHFEVSQRTIQRDANKLRRLLQEDFFA